LGIVINFKKITKIAYIEAKQKTIQITKLLE